jgi:hypothetical protein
MERTTWKMYMVGVHRWQDGIKMGLKQDVRLLSGFILHRVGTSGWLL